MNRKNAVLFIVIPPAVEYIDDELKKRLGVERSVNIVKDVIIKTYSKITNSPDYIVLISYFFSKRFPDLRWLDVYEPGYLDVSGCDYQTALLKSADYAFRVGAEKVLWINPLVPFIEKTDINLAFSNIKDKQVVLGPASNGGIYLFGGNQEAFKVATIRSMLNDTDFDETVDKIRRSRFLIFEMEQKPIIKDDDSLRKWVETPDFTLDLKPEHSEHKLHKKKSKESKDSQSDTPDSSEKADHLEKS